MKESSILEIVRAIDPANAEYIMQNEEIVRTFCRAAEYMRKGRGKNGLPLEDAVEECFGANTPENYEKGVRFVASLGKMGIIPSYEADRIVSQMDEIISQEG